MHHMTPDTKRAYIRRYSRARNRALRALAERHYYEYRALLAAERTRPDSDEPGASETV